MGRATYYLDDEITESIEKKLELKIIKNKSEYVNKALKFYEDYNNSSKSNDFILKGVDEIVKAELEKFEMNFSKRVLSLLSNLGIEVGILRYAIYQSFEIDEENYNAIRKKVVDEMKENNSVFKYYR